MGYKHPGEILRRYVEDYDGSQAEFATALGISPAYLSDVLRAKRRISPRLALRLESHLHPTAVFWLTHQMYYDLDSERERLEVVSTAQGEERE